MANKHSFLNRCIFLLPISIHAFSFLFFKKGIRIILNSDNSYFMEIDIFTKDMTKQLEYNLLTS